MISNEDIRNFLIEEYGEDKGNSIVLLPYYASAFDGISMTGIAIYDFDKMVLWYALENHIQLDEAKAEVKSDIEGIVQTLGKDAPIFNLGNPLQ